MSRRAVIALTSAILIVATTLTNAADSRGEDPVLYLDDCLLLEAMIERHETRLPLPVHCQSYEDPNPVPTDDPTRYYSYSVVVSQSPASQSTSAAKTGRRSPILSSSRPLAPDR